MATNSPNKDPKADRIRKKEKGRRLWAKIDAAMKKLNDELGYPAGAVMVKDGRIQSCGTLGAAATAAQRLSLAQSVRSEVFEKSRGDVSNVNGSTSSTAETTSRQDARGCFAQGPTHAVYLTPLPRPIENLTETELRSWVPKFVKESTGRNQPRWGDEKFKPPWWPTHVLPFENVNRDHRLVKGSSYADALRDAVRACLEYHNIPVDQAVQTTYMESGKAHRKLTECASNVCKGTAPLALVASREATSPEDSENLTRAATLLSEQVTFLLQIAQGLSAADVLTSLSRPVTNSTAAEEEPMQLLPLSTTVSTAGAGNVVIDEGPFPLVGTSIVGNGLEEVMVDATSGFVATLEAASRASPMPGVSVTTTPHSVPHSLVAAAVGRAATAAVSVAPSTDITFNDQLTLTQDPSRMDFEQQLRTTISQAAHASAVSVGVQSDRAKEQASNELSCMIPVSILPTQQPTIQHVEQSIVVPEHVQTTDESVISSGGVATRR
ncbi:uncharacterized protein LOC135805351 [Sycon ciliatum]|uniref:uncharacterized protein LOC135805351 n=1 Tax=Sycon ciliatum TaxID=27933 RepID=UPI0020ABD744|eukprot:scpid69492/ scgid25714/ DNA-binding protein Ewg; Protein erect wing